MRNAIRLLRQPVTLHKGLVLLTFAGPIRSAHKSTAGIKGGYKEGLLESATLLEAPLGLVPG
jgi:hypothetical protein